MVDSAARIAHNAPLMDLERDLNPEQLSAVVHGDGPLLILAGAGSGKTRVITHRIAHLIRERGVAPWQILAVTFTNKAAGEMRERIEALVGPAAGLWALTFHAFGARLLRRYADYHSRGRDFSIYDADDSKRLGRLVLERLDADRELNKPETLLAAVERCKRQLRPDDRTGLKGVERAFYALYNKLLRQADAFDFADLLLQPNRLLDRHPEVLAELRGRFQYVLVDEFQDTDAAQFALLRKLCPPAANLCVVGDDDQSIYRWRGAEVGNILDFAQHYPDCTEVKLERNYRSSASILRAAGDLIAHNPRRHEKRLWTEAPPGAPVSLLVGRDERDEARQVAAAAAAAVERDGLSLSEVAVFYRTNAQSRALEEGVRLYGLPYRVVGGVRFFERAEIRDLVAYLRLAVNPASDVDLLRVLNTPPRGLGRQTRQRLVALAEQHDCPIAEVLTPGRLGGLRATERKRALAFRALLDELADCAAGRPAAEVVGLLIERSGYAAALERQGDLEAEGRLENLRELVTAAEDFARGTEDESLGGFLEHVALLTDIDQAAERSGALTLMTLHAAKGLEFDRVFITGLEEGLLPHRRALDDDPSGGRSDGGVAEERRLFYVGMTRARQQLVLCQARSRSLAGGHGIATPSRFLREVPGLLGAGAERSGELIEPGGFDLDDEDDIFGDGGPDGDELVVDYGDEYSQVAGAGDPNAWHGRWVEHATFGRGRVRSVEASPRGAKLVVVFESIGPKSVMADYVRPL